MATLGAKSTSSAKAAPRQACGQSTMIRPRSAVSSTLSARMSACSSAARAECGSQADSSRASSSRCARDHGSRRSCSADPASVRQPLNIPACTSAKVRTWIGAGVSASASRSRMPISCARSAARQGSAGGRPPTSSSTSANQGPRSTVPRSRGAGTCPATMSGSSAARCRASRRCISGLSGFASADTALTNHRVPSAQRTLAATPGLNPPGCVLAAVTGAPQTSSTAARTFPGRSAQATRIPSAAGAVMPVKPAASPGGRQRVIRGPGSRWPAGSRASGRARRRRSATGPGR